MNATIARLTLAVAALAALPSGAFTTAALAAPKTTVQATIVDCDRDPCDRSGEPDNLLEFGPGEPYVLIGRVPENLHRPRTSSILNFLQLTDFQAIDEESPARVEFLDTTQRLPGAAPLSAAYRPQESLTTQIVEAMVRQVRNTTSEVTGAPVELTILTGDNADSQQYNETRWFIDTLDGHKRIDPNSGIPIPGCEATPGSIYDGVRNSGVAGVPDDGYYEPDGSTGAKIDGDGYSPDRARNAAETQRDVTVRDFPGLFEVANQPFQATGLGMPWYSAFGNHDALIQGNSPDAFVGPLGPSGEVFNPVFRAVATGCVKVMQVSASVQGLLQQLLAIVNGLLEGIGSLTASEQRTLDETTARIRRIAAREQRLATCKFAKSKPAGCPAAADNTFDGTVAIVPPDERRCHLAKADGPLPGGGSPPPCHVSWIGQHFDTTGTPVGHGFANRPSEAVANHDGYYAFSPRPGLRFLVLDTITDECGSIVCAEGSVDDAQFRWMDREITSAAEAGQYVMVFSHHTLRTTRAPSTDLTEYPIHYGQRIDRQNPANPQNPAGGETLEELYCRHPNVLAHISGHEHENFVRQYKCANDLPPVVGATSPGFVHVSTAAHLDWPQQSRMIELVDNGEQPSSGDDPGMSLVLTMLDHAGPPFPGQPKPCPNPGPNCELTDTGGQAGDQPLKLASIGREIAYNDYQANRGARGMPQDRNVIVELARPWPYPQGG